MKRKGGNSSRSDFMSCPIIVFDFTFIIHLLFVDKEKNSGKVVTVSVRRNNVDDWYAILGIV